MEIDKRIEQWRERTKGRKDPEIPEHVHRWGTAYKSSGGRRVCVECGYVTDKPFESLGVSESER